MRNTILSIQSSTGLKAISPGGQNARRSLSRISSGVSCTNTADAGSDLLIFIAA